IEHKTSTSHRVKLRAQNDIVSFHVTDGEPILYAALRQGVNLQHECATGTCGACKARLVEGKAVNLWREAPGAKSLKSERGEHLLCQTTARGECLFQVARHPKEQGAVQPNYRDGCIIESKSIARDVLHLRVGLPDPISFLAGQFVLLETEAIKGPR